MVVCKPLEFDRLLAALLAHNFEAASPEILRIFERRNFLCCIFKLQGRQFRLPSLFLIEQGSREMVFGGRSFLEFILKFGRHAPFIDSWATEC